MLASLVQAMLAHINSKVVKCTRLVRCCQRPAKHDCAESMVVNCTGMHHSLFLPPCPHASLMRCLSQQTGCHHQQGICSGTELGCYTIMAGTKSEDLPARMWGIRNSSWLLSDIASRNYVQTLSSSWCWLKLRWHHSSSMRTSAIPAVSMTEYCSLKTLNREPGNHELCILLV